MLLYLLPTLKRIPVLFCKNLFKENLYALVAKLLETLMKTALMYLICWMKPNQNYLKLPTIIFAGITPALIRFWLKQFHALRT